MKRVGSQQITVEHNIRCKIEKQRNDWNGEFTV